MAEFEGQGLRMTLLALSRFESMKDAQAAQQLEQRETANLIISSHVATNGIS